MTIEKSLLMLVTHLVPILYFMYITVDLLIRNNKKLEHRLLALISISYMMLFLAEYVRNQVDIQYSPNISSLWFSTFGILIPAFGMHFFIKITNLEKMNPTFFKYVILLSYSPILLIIINIITKAAFFSAHQFEQNGIWISPIYNFEYYMTMVVGICSHFVYITLLLIAKKHVTTKQQKSVLKFMLLTIVISFFVHILLGFINFGKYLPPYPYIYSGIIWCYFLKIAMKKHNFLSFYDERFLKLFEMNPNIILLFNSRLDLVNQNPKARHFFHNLQITFDDFYYLLNDNLKETIANGQNLYNFETDFVHHHNHFYLLVHVEYLEIDYDQHTLMIVQDITFQKKQQEEIKFLANHDPLTLLPNRRFFYEKIELELEKAKDNHEELGIFLLDLNKFKRVNDTFGHHKGDEILIKVANIFKSIVEPNGFACRLGGDEFLLFVRSSTIINESNSIIQKIRESFLMETEEYQSVGLGISIGVSIYPKDATDLTTLIQIADDKMYSMKNKKNKGGV